MNLYEIIVAALFSVWFLISIYWQFRLPSFRGILASYDVFNLIPSWNFFAPNPLTRDFKVLYRYRLIDEQLTHWMQVRQKADRVPILVSTGKRLRKGLMDLCLIFFHSVAGKKKLDDTEVLSLSYLCLLNYLSSLPRSPFAKEIQYLIVATHGPDETAQHEILFTSHFHALA